MSWHYVRDRKEAEGVLPGWVTRVDVSAFDGPGYYWAHQDTDWRGDPFAELQTAAQRAEELRSQIRELNGELEEALRKVGEAP